MNLLKRHFLGIVAVALAAFSAEAADAGHKLLNIDFSSFNGNIKTGPAAIGDTDTDYWNLYDNTTGGIRSEPDGPRWSDKTATGMKLSVSPAGAWGTGSSDPMLHTYIYSSGPLTSTLTNFPESTVDVYIYAHGLPGGENGVISLAVNGQSQGKKSTTTNSTWDTAGWTEGNEYVVFRNVMVPANARVEIVAEPGASGVAVLNGAQFIVRFPATPPIISRHPAPGTAFPGDTIVLSVEATGSDMSYQWRLNDVPLEGKTASTLEISNFGPNNVGAYSIRVTNPAGEALSKRANWALATKVPSPLIDVNYTAHLNSTFSVKNGPAAIGVAASDYWNVYSRDVSSEWDWRAGGVVTGLKLTDGTTTPASLIVTNAAGAWLTLTDDPMLKSYLYPLNGATSIISTFSGLPAKRYDVLVYAHGQPNEENAVVELRLNDITIETRSTSSQPGWDGAAWVEGNQFITFRGIEITDGSRLDVISRGGVAGMPVINGVQLAGQETALRIVSQPVSQVITTGQPAVFTVAVEGSGLILYQWIKNGVELTGETNSQLNIVATSSSDVATYNVRVRNDTSIAVSSPATLTLDLGISQPLIVEQPVGGSYFAGDSVSIKVRAEGGGLKYQWRKGDVALEGQTGSSLQIASFSAADVGAYSAVVSNDAGTVRSSRATLSLATRASGKLLAVDYTAHLNAAFSVKSGPAAIGVLSNDFWNVYSRDVTTQWDWRSSGTVSGLKWTDGTPAGASLSVTDAGGAWFTLSDDPMLKSYLYPLSRSGVIASRLDNLPAQRYDIYVYAHGQPTNENAAIELKVGGIPVATRSTSSTAGWDAPAWVDGNQFVLFSGIEVPAGVSVEIISRPASADIAVINGVQLAALPSELRIVTQPLSRTVTAGARVVFTVQAEGTGTLAYQWLRNGAEIQGATSSEFVIESAALSDAAGYAVRVRNASATVVSELATLTVTGGTTVVRNLLNLDYGTTADFGRKFGPAAVGLTSTDYWNVYSRDTQSLVESPQGMKWSDGTLAGVQISVENADGAWGSNAEDIMMHTYLYPISRSGDIPSTFTAMPAGLYDVFVYAHGQPPEENGVIELSVNGVSQGVKTTSSASDWDSPGWTEGKEYVLFAAVDVPTNAVVQIVAKPGVSGLSVINGAQFLSAPQTPSAPGILAQPEGGSRFIGQTISLSVTAQGSRPLTYQWRHEGTNLVASERITGIDSPYLTINALRAEDAGAYSVVVKNSLGEATSNNAQLAVNADTEAPTVVIASPAAGAQASSSFNLTGTVTDNNGIASVTWQRNGIAMGSLTVTDGRFSVGGLRLDPGETSIRVIATDVSGNQTVAERVVSFTVPRALVAGPLAPHQDGSRVFVPVSIVSTGGVSGATFTLTFDTNYLADPQFEWSNSLDLGFTSANLETPRRFRASFALPAVNLEPGSNRVATVSFRARSVPNTLQTSIGVEIIGMYDDSGNPYLTGNSASPAALTITKRKIVGDNNANNRLDVGDASVMLKMVSRIEPVRFWDPPLNDLNKNQDLDSGDVIRVLRAVVGLDPQPTVVAAAAPPKKAQTAESDEEGGGSGVITVISNPPPPIFVLPDLPDALVADKATAVAGEKVTVDVRLNNQTKPISGASFRLEYPVAALRLDSASAHQVGSMVPSGSVSVWNVSPSQNNYATQDGAVSLAISSANAWPTNNGVLARFTFTVQPGATALYSWPVLLKTLEVSRDGFTTEVLGQDRWTFTGHSATEASLSPTISFNPDGTAKLTLHGDPGATFTVEASYDLKNWSPIFTDYTADGTISFTDPSNITTNRFFRAIQLPNQ